MPIPAREALLVELARLDAILRALWPAVLTGDVPACRTALACLDRRAKYLGLDSPARLIVEADGVEVVPINNPDEAYAHSAQRRLWLAAVQARPR